MDLHECNIDIHSWQTTETCGNAVMDGIATFEANQRKEAEAKRKLRKEKVSDCQSHPPQNSGFVCNLYGKDCGAFIGLHSHTRKCSRALSN